MKTMEDTPERLGADPQDGGDRRRGVPLDIQRPHPFLRAAPLVVQERQVQQHIGQLQEIPADRPGRETRLLEGRGQAQLQGRAVRPASCSSCSRCPPSSSTTEGGEGSGLLHHAQAPARRPHRAGRLPLHVSAFQRLRLARGDREKTAREEPHRRPGEDLDRRPRHGQAHVLQLQARHGRRASIPSTAGSGTT